MSGDARSPSDDFRLSAAVEEGPRLDADELSANADVSVNDGQVPLRRAMVLMTATSLFVPIAGLVVQPILARGLSVSGRGELAAVLAPAILMLAVGTLGMPDAITYLLARRPSLTRAALLSATLLTFLPAALCVGIVFLSLPALSLGDPRLGTLVLIAVALTVPALFVGVLRGAARGRQRWGLVATERLLTSCIRVVLLGGLWWLDALTVLGAVLVSTLAPVVSGVVYLPLFRAVPRDGNSQVPVRVTRLLATYGTRVWVGSVASMLIARTDQVLLAPLSDVETLGLFAVAVAVADVPTIVIAAIGDTLLGVESRDRNKRRLVDASRSVLLIGCAGAATLATMTPLLVPFFFGDEFRGAIVPTLILLLASVVSIPGLMASSALGAWGRPGLRSSGMVFTFSVNVACFVVVVPLFGLLGACVTALFSMTFLSIYMTVAAWRVLEVSPFELIAVRPADVARTARAVVEIVQRRRRPSDLESMES